jgi:hypothetical protein
MRRIACIAGLILVVQVPPGAADTPGTGAAPVREVSLDAVVKELVVLHDGAGHYIVALPFQLTDHLYYGNGKRFHQQRLFGGGADQAGGSFSQHFWEPRSNHRADLELAGGKWRVRCGERETALAPLPAGEARTMIDRADFLRPLWTRQAYALARDERGTYYYIDRLRDEAGGKGFRLFVGPKGRLRNTRMINIINDSEGDIFATRSGELRLILGKRESTWLQRKRRTALLTVPVEDNVQMIYAELGVYRERLGTPCDDL